MDLVPLACEDAQPVDNVLLARMGGGPSGVFLSVCFQKPAKISWHFMISKNGTTFCKGSKQHSPYAQHVRQK